jgi:hypothetical protein
MSWCNGFALVGLLAIGAWLLWEIHLTKRPPFVKYRDVNAPGCFQVGKDVK